MFKKTEDNQLDLFSSISSVLPKGKAALLDKSGSFHKVFLREVINKIDEGIFKVLYSEDNGRPNASIRVMIGMMILKEGNGWSDEQLFDSCRFDLRIMLSLGLSNIQDDIPTESSYYLFRKRIVDYKASAGVDLFDQSFKGVTLKQMQCHGVSGKMIRMDSKLISSNIAKCNRVSLIAKVLERSIKGLDLECLKGRLTEGQLKLLEQIGSLGTSKVIYQMSSEECKEALKEIGFIIARLQSIGKSTMELNRLFDEQYTVIGDDTEEEEGVQKHSPLEKKSQMACEANGAEQCDQNQTEDEGAEQNEGNNRGSECIQNQELAQIKPKAGKEISSGSMQSPHDPEATYRSKGKGLTKQEVQGYHVNITETCNEEESLNLITDVQTKQANKSESEFMNQAILTTDEMSRKAHGRGVKEVVTDGGYDSVDNRKEMLQNKKDITWHLAKTKGRKRAYDMSRDEQGNLEVLHRESGKKCEVIYKAKLKKYRIENPNRTKRYFTEQEIDAYIAYAQLDSQEPDEKIYCIRSNVESTIHQVFHRVGKRQKIKYRGYDKSHIYALSRAFWVNCKRIFGKTSEIISYVLFLIFSPIMENLSHQKSFSNVKHCHA